MLLWNVKVRLESAFFGPAVANLLCSQVLNRHRKGREEDVLRALELILRKGKLPAVVNLSLRKSHKSPTLSAAIRALIAAGFSVVVGAGNEGGWGVSLHLCQSHLTPSPVSSPVGVDSCSVSPAEDAFVEPQTRENLVKDGVISVAAVNMGLRM